MTRVNKRRNNVCAWFESTPIQYVKFNRAFLRKFAEMQTVTGGVVAKLVGWSTHLFVSGRGFESFRYDGAELM